MKTRRVVLILAILAMLAVLTSSTWEARASANVSSVISGDRYTLTLESQAIPPGGGYQLLDASTLAVPAPGCCCRSCLPAIRK